MECSCEFESGLLCVFGEVGLCKLSIFKSEDANSYVNGKELDLSVASLNALASAPNDGKKFFDAHGWMGMSEVEPIDILRVVLDNLSEVIRPTASDLSTIEGSYIIWEVREKPKESKEYNKKTLRLMGFMQNEDGEWVRKGVVTPQKGREGGSDSEEESEDEEEEATARTPMGTRTPIRENTPLSVSPPPIGYSSRRVTGSSHAPRCLKSFEMVWRL
ncbi:hypothetical protein CJ030_MR8G002124 [Morella rubra]|uniref:Uncharacterized protein n=1 Tax=Morella rubra TaxID=262757 RepID=A0A6A1UUP6_9ROSI|nr:hypothetical protein CJ030_MR8G002124 [Morella rubra]